MSRPSPICPPPPPAPTTPPAPTHPPTRKLYRSAEGRLLGGVARGLAGHLGLPVSWVRAVFLALSLIDGLGVLLYAAFWFVVPLGTGGSDGMTGATFPATGRDGDRRRFLRKLDKGQLIAVLALVAGALVLVNQWNVGLTNSYLWPVLLIGSGVILVWRQADDSRRAYWVAQWAEVSRHARLFVVVRGTAGVLLVAVGVSVIVLGRTSATYLGSVLQATLAILVGVGLLAGPYLVRMVQDLSEERLMRIRAQERAEVAAHVHDSVLHTLTLIQRNSDRSREVARLARAQERELRAWLYKQQGDGKNGETGRNGKNDGRAENGEKQPGTLAAAVRATAAEVEDHHGVPVEVVCVGDAPLDERLRAQLQAAREAMVNAAKYGGEGGDTVQVFAEVEKHTVFVSVRDRGPGFDADAVPKDRMGVRESIIGRMRRNGGTARLRSAPGEGTEVELEMERHGEGAAS